MQRLVNLFGSTRLLGKKHSMDVGQYTTAGNSYTSKQLVELLVVLDGKSQMTGHDTALLVIAGGVTGKLEDLSAEVLEDGSEVDGGTSSHTGGVLALTEVTSWVK